MQDDVSARMRIELEEVQLIPVSGRSSLLRVTGRVHGSGGRLAAIDVVAEAGGRRQVLAPVGGPQGTVVATPEGICWTAGFVVTGAALEDASISLRFHANVTVALGRGVEAVLESERRRARPGRRRDSRLSASVQAPKSVTLEKAPRTSAQGAEELGRGLADAQAARRAAEHRTVGLEARAQWQQQAASVRVDDLLAALAEALNRLSNTELALAAAEGRAKRQADELAARQVDAGGRGAQPSTDSPDELAVISEEEIHMGLERLGSDTR